MEINRGFFFSLEISMKIKRRFKQGAQSISNGLAKVIGWENIILKSPVSLIDQSENYTVVVTDDGFYSKVV
jgi:hypothetical protein